MSGAFQSEATGIAANMLRLAVARAARPGILLAQEKYHTDQGLVLVIARWGVNDLSLGIEWCLAERGHPPRGITPTQAATFIAERMQSRLGTTEETRP